MGKTNTNLASSTPRIEGISSLSNVHYRTYLLYGSIMRHDMILRETIRSGCFHFRGATITSDFCAQTFHNPLN